MAPGDDQAALDADQAALDAAAAAAVNDCRAVDADYKEAFDELVSLDPDTAAERILATAHDDEDRAVLMRFAKALLYTMKPHA